MEVLKVCERWAVNCEKSVITLPRDVAEQGVAILEKWSNIFPKENTWVQNNCGIPSIIVRLEGIITNDGQLKIFEVEERPAGIGVTTMINHDFKERLGKISASWPQFKVVLSPRRQGAGDDYLWRQVISRFEIKDHLVIVRAEPEEEEFWNIESRSVSSLKEKGNKSYGVYFGWWHEISSPEELLWEKGFVLKPLKGSKARGVEIWDPEKRRGFATRSRILRTIEKYGRMYVQPFVLPTVTHHGYTIFRIFYGYDLGGKKWICLGGAYNARPNLKIHGASDAVFGPFVLEK